PRLLLSPLDRLVPSIGAAEDRFEEPDGALLVERFVAVAALRGLDARRAPALAAATPDDLERRLLVLACPQVSPLGDSHAARVAVVDEDRRQAGVGRER